MLTVYNTQKKIRKSYVTSIKKALERSVEIIKQIVPIFVYYLVKKILNKFKYIAVF